MRLGARKAASACTLDAAVHRVPNLTGGTVGGDVLADPRDHVRPPMLQGFASDARLGFTKAVTENSFPAGTLRRHWYPDVVGAKLIAGIAEVHRVATRVGAKTVVRHLNASKSNLRLQRFDGPELNR